MRSKPIIDLTYDLNPRTPVYPNYPPVEITIHETVSDFQASPKFDPATKVGLMHRLQSCSAGNFLVGEEPPDGCRAVENTRKLSRWRHWAQFCCR